MKEEMMDRACSMHGRAEKFIINFGWKTRNSEDLGIDGKVILE
jgi:hypothetical protein